MIDRYDIIAAVSAYVDIVYVYEREYSQSAQTHSPNLHTSTPIHHHALSSALAIHSNLTMTVVDSVSTTANAFLTTLQQYVSTHHDGIVALLLFIGVIVAFSGKVLLSPTVFLLGFLPTTVSICALAAAFGQDQQDAVPHLILIEAICIIFAILIGILVGVVLLRLLFRIATFLLCAGFGAVLVFVLHLYLLQPAVAPNAQFFLYCAALFAALIAGLFSVSYPETAIILGTAFDGAALAVFSLARFLGQRPNLFSGIVQTPDTASPWWTIAYATATLLLGILGAITQHQVATAVRLMAAQKADGTRPNAKPAGAQSQDASIAPPLPFGFAEEDPLIPPLRTPPSRSGMASPGSTSGYGAVGDDSHYNVMQNLGAAPLGSSLDNFKISKDVNGPLPL